MYHIEIKRQALKEIELLPEKVQIQIIDKIDVLKIDPRPSGSLKLQGSKDRWRIRVGNYRILYTIHDETKIVYIYRALHRKEVYR